MPVPKRVWCETIHTKNVFQLLIHFHANHIYFYLQRLAEVEQIMLWEPSTNVKLFLKRRRYNFQSNNIKNENFF